MKKFFKKIRSYGFWVALASAVVVLLDRVGKLCGFSIENKLVEDVILSIASLLAVFGIVNMNPKKEENQDTQEENQDTQQENQDKNFEDKNEQDFTDKNE